MIQKSVLSALPSQLFRPRKLPPIKNREQFLRRFADKKSERQLCQNRFLNPIWYIYGKF